jgi:hypothetical protein
MNKSPKLLKRLWHSIFHLEHPEVQYINRAFNVKCRLHKWQKLNLPQNATR